MADPFLTREPKEGLTSWISKRGRARAAREIESLLAAAGRVREVSAEQVAEVAEAQGVDLVKRLRTPCQGLYRRFLEHCLDDQALSDEELADLEHLRAILHVSPQVAERIQDEVVRTIYGHAVDEVLSDQQIDPEEEVFLEQLRAGLRLPEEVAAAELDEGGARAKHRYIERNLEHSTTLLASNADTALRLRGESFQGLDDAVVRAMQEARKAVPELVRAEVSRIDVSIDADGDPVWHVELKVPLVKR